MTILEKLAEPLRTEPDAPRARLLVLMADEKSRELICAWLAGAGQRPAAAVADQTELAEQPQLDERAVVVVGCDVDRPRDVTALRRLRRAANGAAIVVVSPRTTATGVRRTLDAGADALVFEPELAQALIPTLRAVENGQSVVPRNMRAGVQRPYLSHRERQVLSLVCDGLTNAEIAETLVLAESTIKSHLASIFTKFGVHSRKEAVAAIADLDPESSNPPAQEQSAA